MAGTRTREAQLSVRYYDRGGDGDGVEGGQEGQQEGGHIGGASSVKRPRIRGQTLWQTPRGVGLTPKKAGVRTGALYSDHDGEDDVDGTGGGNQQGEKDFGSSFSFERPRARGQTLWQTPRGVGLTPRKTTARTGASPLSVHYYDNVEECGGEDQQEGEHTGTASPGRRARARGQTLWQTPRGVGLTPKVEGPRTEEQLSVRHRGDGGGECGVEQRREQEQPGSALSADRPRAGGQTLWQTPRGVGPSPKMAGARTGAPLSGHASDGGNEDGVGVGHEEQQGGKSFNGACSFERPRARGLTLWQTPRGVGLSPKMAGARTRTPLADRYHDNDSGGCGGGEYGEKEQQQGEHPGNPPSVRGPRARGQTVWQTPRGVGLTPKTAGTRRGSPPSGKFWKADDDVVGGTPLGQQDEGDPDNTSSSVARPRARGQTVWQTPRGVGLTPKKGGEGAHAGEPFSTTTDYIGEGSGYGDTSCEQDLGRLADSGATPPGQAPRGRGLFPSTPRVG